MKGAIIGIMRDPACMYRFYLQGDISKLKFTTEAFSMTDPTLARKVVPDAVDAAIGWTASATDAQVIDYREAVIAEIEQLGIEMRMSGACDRCEVKSELLHSWCCSWFQVVAGVRR